jgi:hypothetical protein
MDISPFQYNELGLFSFGDCIVAGLRVSISMIIRHLSDETIIFANVGRHEMRL